MKLSNKIAYFCLGALFAGIIGWNFSQPVEAIAPTSVERKVDVLADRETGRIKHDIAALEKAVQEDRDFLKFGPNVAGGKTGAVSQYAQRKSMVEDNLPQKEKQLADLHAQLKTLRM